MGNGSYWEARTKRNQAGTPDFLFILRIAEYILVVKQSVQRNTLEYEIHSCELNIFRVICKSEVRICDELSVSVIRGICRLVPSWCNLSLMTSWELTTHNHIDLSQPRLGYIRFSLVTFLGPLFATAPLGDCSVNQVLDRLGSVPKASLCSACWPRVTRE